MKIILLMLKKCSPGMRYMPWTLGSGKIQTVVVRCQSFIHLPNFYWNSGVEAQLLQCSKNQLESYCGTVIIIIINFYLLHWHFNDAWFLFWWILIPWTIGSFYSDVNFCSGNPGFEQLQLKRWCVVSEYPIYSDLLRLGALVWLYKDIRGSLMKFSSGWSSLLFGGCLYLGLCFVWAAILLIGIA